MSASIRPLGLSTGGVCGCNLCLVIWLYRLALPLLLLLTAPITLRRMWRRGGYGEDWPQRLGCIELPAKAAGRHRVWIHAVSVGELLAVGGLVAQLDARGHEVVLTTTTSTGYALGRERYSGCAHVRLFPIDLWPTRSLGFRRIRPDALVLMESELWPELLHQARRRRVPTALINARLSPRSLKRYRALRPIARALLAIPGRILCASDPDAEHFRALLGSAAAGRVEAVGNLKFDVAPATAPAADRAALARDLVLEDGAAVLVGASTWPGEEMFWAAVAQRLRTQGLDLKLLLVPRHAERREAVREDLKAFEGPVVFRSEGPPESPDWRIYVADTTGELRRLLALATLVFIGKSLPPHTQGQTPIEAASFGLPLLMGPGMDNFKGAAAGLVQVGAARRIHTREDALAACAELLRDEALRRTAGEAARTWASAQRGATERTLAHLQTLWQHPAAPAQGPQSRDQ